MIISRCYEIPLTEFEKVMKLYSKIHNLGLEYCVINNKIKLGTDQCEPFDIYTLLHYFYSPDITDHFTVGNTVYLLGRAKNSHCRAGA